MIQGQVIQVNKENQDQTRWRWYQRSLWLLPLLLIGCSDGGLAGGFGPESSGPAQEGVGGPEAAGRHRQTQTGPGAADGPAVPVIHVHRQTVDEGRVPGEVIGHTGCVRTQGDGAEDPCKDKRSENLNPDQ